MITHRITKVGNLYSVEVYTGVFWKTWSGLFEVKPKYHYEKFPIGSRGYYYYTLHKTVEEAQLCLDNYLEYLEK